MMVQVKLLFHWIKHTFELYLQLMYSIEGNLAILTYHNLRMHIGSHGYSISLMWLSDLQYWNWLGRNQTRHQQSLKFNVAKVISCTYRKLQWVCPYLKHCRGYKMPFGILTFCSHGNASNTIFEWFRCKIKGTT